MKLIGTNLLASSRRVFDVMFFRWIPLQCYDAEVTGGFLAAHGWRFYFR